MKQFKLTFVLTILMSMVGLQSFAAWDTSTEVQVGDLNYYLDNDNLQALVTSMSSGSYIGIVEIPSSIIYNEKTYNVTSIGDLAFVSCTRFSSIIISNSVTSIGNKAFFGCYWLYSVIIGNSVTSIGDLAFCGCSSLKTVTIPNSVKSIGNDVFDSCSGLTSIIVESGNTKYDSRDDCNAIIETASNTLVFGCKNTIIPNSVTSIGEYAFSYCSSLKTVTIPNSVKSIGEWAFGHCSGLTSVTIGNSVTSIGNAAFCSCSRLITVTVLNPTPVAIDQYVFTNRANATLYVPKGSKDTYKKKNYWNEFKEIVEIEVTGIDQISFQENGEQGIDQEGAVWYTIDGKRVDKPKKGINIIRMSDGTTKKVVVK